MTTERNKDIYRRYLELGFNEGRMDVLDELIDPSYVYHEAPPGTPAGPDGIKHVVKMFHAAFSDFKITIEDMVAEDDKVVVRATTRGIHRGPFAGIPPTGRSVVITGLTMVRIKEGRIVESWVKNDVMGLMKQLGALP